jgi:hypothetical protein
MTLTPIKESLSRHRSTSLLLALLLVGAGGALARGLVGIQPRNASAADTSTAADAAARAESVAAAELAAKMAQSKDLWNTLHQKGGIPATQAFCFDNSYYTPATPQAENPGAQGAHPSRAVTPAIDAPTPAERLRQQAANLKVQSIVMAAIPLAVIDGHLYRVGDQVLNFRVAVIRTRSIVLEKDDLKITLELGK